MPRFHIVIRAGVEKGKSEQGLETRVFAYGRQVGGLSLLRGVPACGHVAQLEIRPRGQRMPRDRHCGEGGKNPTKFTAKALSVCIKAFGLGKLAEECFMPVIEGLPFFSGREKAAGPGQ